MPGYSSFVQKRSDIEFEQVALTTGQVNGADSLGISLMCIACSNQFLCRAKKSIQDFQHLVLFNASSPVKRSMREPFAAQQKPQCREVCARQEVHW